MSIIQLTAKEIYSELVSRAKFGSGDWDMKEYPSGLFLEELRFCNGVLYQKYLLEYFSGRKS
jgi:hypothetical protein